MSNRTRLAVTYEHKVHDDFDYPTTSLVMYSVSTSEFSKSYYKDKKNVDKLKHMARNVYSCEFGCNLDRKTFKEIVKLSKSRKQLFTASLFCILFMMLEFAAGYLQNSIALMSNALQLLSACFGLMMSVVAFWFAQKGKTIKYSYGHERAGAVGALFSVFFIWGLAIWFIVQSLSKLLKHFNDIEHKEVLNGQTMFIIAVCDILVNIFMIGILYQKKTSGKSKININVRSGYILCLYGLCQSIGVSIAAVLIWYDEDIFSISDPICTLIFSILGQLITVRLLKDSVGLLMESNLGNVDVNVISKELLSIQNVIDIHDLHVWNLTHNKITLTCHILVGQTSSLKALCMECILYKSQKICLNVFGIKHTTIQIEWPHKGNGIHKSKSSSSVSRFRCYDCFERDNISISPQDNIPKKNLLIDKSMLGSYSNVSYSPARNPISINS